MDWNDIGKDILAIDYDPKREFAEFLEQFITAANLTRTVHDVLVDQKLKDVSGDIQKLPKKDDLETGLYPINQKLEELSHKDKRLDSEQIKRIAAESLNRHRARFSFSKDDEKAREVLRDIHATILESLLQSPKPIIGIMGPSGIGKSTLLRQIGCDINNKGDRRRQGRRTKHLLIAGNNPIGEIYRGSTCGLYGQGHQQHAGDYYRCRGLRPKNFTKQIRFHSSPLYVEIP